MTRIGIIRCEKNEGTCPLTSCFNTMMSGAQGFSAYDECTPAGVFTCRCPGDSVANLGKILKSKGAIYQSRNPKASAYYKCVENHFEELERAWDDMYKSRYGFWRTYVMTVIYKYLDCGDLYMKHPPN